MFDRIFSALLAFGMLFAATLAIGAAWFEAPPTTAQRPRADVVIKRVALARAPANCDASAATQLR